MSNQFALTATTTLVTEECCKCHILFAIPKALQDNLLEWRGPNGREFFCPNGHAQHYIGETEAQRLKRELDEAKARIERVERQKLYLNQCADQDQAAIRDLSNQVRGQKAAKTKLLRRITNGVCPCCQRSFADVQRHMSTKHPGEVVSAEAAAANGGRL